MARDRIPSARELGFAPIPGSARKYVELATGEVRSRRYVEDVRRGGHGAFRVEQRRSLDVRAEAFGGGREFERERRTGRYQRFASLYAEERQENTPRGSFSNPSSDFNIAYAEALAAGWPNGWRRNPALRDPDGPLARLLILVGLRSSEDTWPVGSSPGTGQTAA